MSSTEVDNLWSQLRSALAELKWQLRARRNGVYFGLPTCTRIARHNVRVYTARVRKLRRQLNAAGALG